MTDRAAANAVNRLGGVAYEDEEHVMQNWILDEDGNPKQADMLEWGAWFKNNHTTHQVGSTDFGSLGSVSTTFLGIDRSSNVTEHGGPTHRPVLWESMIFGGPLAEDQDRYTSKDDALKGHERMCQRLRDIQDLIVKKFGDAWSELSEEDLQCAVDTMLRLGGIEVDAAVSKLCGNW